MLALKKGKPQDRGCNLGALAMKKFFLSIIFLSMLVTQLSLAHISEQQSILDQVETQQTLTPDQLPCDGIITSEFGVRKMGRHAKMHEGIDIAAPVGTPIYSPAQGEVIFAGHKRGYGLTVILEHEGELQTLYGHNSKLFVKEGDSVQKGDEISQVGNTGHSTGPHLHYEVLLGQQPVDPSNFI
jgi:Membrane proteins related to metalloendopeptidases